MRAVVVVGAGGGRSISATVCEPCKRRKKACDKSLPGCGRCNRLLVKCSYTPEGGNFSEAASSNGLEHRPDVLPPPDDVSDFVTPCHSYELLTPPRSEIGGVPPSQPRSRSIEDSVSVQVRRLLNAITRKRGHDSIRSSCVVFFRGFNWSLPVVNQAEFWARFENVQGIGEKSGFPPSEEGPHFSALVLAVFLVSFIYPQQRGGLSTDEVYATTKSIFGLLQSTGNVSIEIVQVGLLLASWEWCKGLQHDAWLTVGGCVRMAQVLGFHHLRRERCSEDADDQGKMEKGRIVWWCCVVLERIIQSEPKNCDFPCASAPPQVSDLLPERSLTRVRDGLLLPQDVDLTAPLQTRGFTTFGTFSMQIQTIFLSDLVMQHVMCRNRSEEERDTDEKKLDVALQYFTGALIPGPGQSSGGYCGAFGILANAKFVLHQYTLSYATDLNTVNRTKAAIRSLTRIIILTAKFSTSGVPMDCNSLAFWSHKSLYTSALMHIKYGDRDEDWEGDLEVLKNYFKQFEGRFEIFVNGLKEIETAQHRAL